MKGSHALLKLSLACSLWLGSSLLLAEANGSPVKLEGYLSTLKEQQFAYEYRKNEAEASKLRDSWIQPIVLSYSYKKSDPYGVEQESESAAITIDQPIFQSGGIYYGIRFAEASRNYADLSVDQQKRKLVKETVALLMQIRKSDLQLDRQKLQIANAQIALEQKREQYLNGQLDSGFLNSAIIDTNVVTQAYYDLETNRERLLSNYRSMSDLDPSEAQIPHLRLLGESEFLENNIDLAVIESEVEKERYNKNVTIAKYLPKVSLTASRNWDKYDKRSFGSSQVDTTGAETYYTTYGWKASMPLDINVFRDVESARVTYLKAKVLVDDKKRELRALFEQVQQNLANYEKKMELAKRNEELYATLLEETRTLYEAGYKTIYDVENLENSVKIQVIERKVLEMDKQLELLDLYEKLANDV